MPTIIKSGSRVCIDLALGQQPCARQGVAQQVGPKVISVLIEQPRQPTEATVWREFERQYVHHVNDCPNGKR